MEIFLTAAVIIFLCDVFCYGCAVAIAGPRGTALYPLSGFYEMYKIAKSALVKSNA